jgi:hypothetical protein
MKWTSHCPEVKKINLRILQREDNAAGTWVSCIRQFNDLHSFPTPDFKQTAGSPRCHKVAIRLSEILHREGNYNRSVRTKISIHWSFLFVLCGTPLLWALNCKHLLSVPHYWNKEVTKVRTFDHLLQYPATFCQVYMISVQADILHTTQSCVGVSKSMLFSKPLTLNTNKKTVG